MTDTLKPITVEKKSSWGGRRPGSGRPPKARTEALQRVARVVPVEVVSDHELRRHLTFTSRSGARVEGLTFDEVIALLRAFV